MTLISIIRDSFARDPNGIVYDGYLHEMVCAGDLEVSLQDIRITLVNMLQSHALDVIFSWQCPGNMGVVMECDHVAKFPKSMKCEQCGQTHDYREHDVELFFKKGPKFDALHSS